MWTRRQFLNRTSAAAGAACCAVGVRMADANRVAQCGTVSKGGLRRVCIVQNRQAIR